MKASICKATLTAVVACLTLGGASLAQAGTCSDSSLKGKYGQTIRGELLPGPGVVLPVNGVAMTEFDGSGKLTQVDFVVINGSPTSSGFQSETGTYHISSDCTGKATFEYADGSEIVLMLVVVNHGGEFRTVVTFLNQTKGGTAVPANIGSVGVHVPDED
jgi:hypothetical protein